jgi:molybdate transport system ATP-binding protein
LLKFNVYKIFAQKKRKVEIACDGLLKLGITTALYGSSGIGKSTIFRMLSGLEKPTHGEIKFENKIWFNDQINTPIKDRKIGYVFQDFNLFPNMNIEKNLAYASPNGIIIDEIKTLIQHSNLSDLMQSNPNDLSAGERQRLAIIRSLCQAPDILFLDEPFSALDDDSIQLIMDEILQLQKKRPLTVGLISHRKDVIFEMAEEMIYMRSNGTNEQGRPKDLISEGIRKS